MVFIYIFLIGLSVGSFLNVVVFRTIKKENFHTNGSYCYSCKTPLKWYDNIPLISYMMLLGKCRTCKTHISIQYPLVELINAIAWVFIFKNFIFIQSFFFSILFSVCLVLVLLVIHTLKNKY